MKLCLPLVTIALSSVGCALAESAWPIWNGTESIEDYAVRAGLPATKTLNAGEESFEFVLIPAGRFVMGTPEPQPVDKDVFEKEIRLGLNALGSGIVVILVLLAAPLFKRPRRLQFSL